MPDASRMGTSAALVGHGDIPGATDAGPVDGGAPTGGPPGPDARVRLTINSPTEISAPEADIAAAHGRPGVAGWTTAAYDVAVPSVQPDRIDVDVTVDFQIELAEEYRGARLDVLRDHEYGHVQIGSDAARAHLLTGLEAGLEGLPGFVPTPPAQAQMVAAAARFVSDESAASQAYDAVDYPRMVEAYLGAATPLKDLAAASKEIDKAAKAFTAFAKRGSKVAGARDLGKLVRAMEKAWSDLGEVDLFRVQYNPEFSDLVDDCADVVDELLDRFESEELTEPMSGEDVEVQRQLDRVAELLDEYEWQPPL